MRRLQQATLTAAAALALFGASAFAGETPHAAEADGAGAVPVSFNGVQVHIDPRTGRLRAPTAAEQQALSRIIQRDAGTNLLTRGRPVDEAAAVASMRTSRTGQVGAMMQLPQSHMTFLTAERQADGSITVQHAHGHAAGHDDSDAVEVTR